LLLRAGGFAGDGRVLTLARATLREIPMQLKAPFRISSGEVRERRALLLELESAAGARTWSECVAFQLPNYSPETVDTAWLALTEWLLPRLLGVPLAGPEAAHALLEADVRGHRMAKAALEMGLWGLAAEEAGEPLARLLGGTRTTVAAGISLGIRPDPEQLVDDATAAAAAGYCKIKLKIGPGADVQYVAAVRRALPDAALMVDANNAYTIADADLLAQLDAYDLEMVEQPLEHEDLVRHAELQQRMRTPICLDESITSLARAEDMIRLGSGRIINIKPGRVGGFTSSLAIHELCAAHDVPVWCGGMLETGIGRAYNIALASLPGFTLPGDLSPSARYWQRDIVSPEWTMDATGHVTVPLDRPGIGVDVDEERIEALTVRRFVATSSGESAASAATPAALSQA
jgi:o-succinylbenzoate synthase